MAYEEPGASGKAILSKKNGVFISFEGGEGAGKSTQIRRLRTLLAARGHDVLVTREPGGSAGGEAVRHVLLSGAAETYGTRMEAILFAAARSDHVEQVIRPALAAGKVVLCDRFLDSSRVYQGVTGNLDRDFVERLQRIAVNGLYPDLTLVIDVPAEIGLARASRRNAADGPDRFEKDALETHEKRRLGFLDIAAAEPARCRVIDGTLSEDAIAARIATLVDALLAPRQATGRAG